MLFCNLKNMSLYYFCVLVIFFIVMIRFFYYRFYLVYNLRWDDGGEGVVVGV